MKKKKLQKAFDAYEKTGDIYALCRTLRELIVYMADECWDGIDIDFAEILPFIVKRLEELDLETRE